MDKCFHLQILIAFDRVKGCQLSLVLLSRFVLFYSISADSAQKERDNDHVEVVQTIRGLWL